MQKPGGGNEPGSSRNGEKAVIWREVSKGIRTGGKPLGVVGSRRGKILQLHQLCFDSDDTGAPVLL